MMHRLRSYQRPLIIAGCILITVFGIAIMIFDGGASKADHRPTQSTLIQSNQDLNHAQSDETAVEGKRIATETQTGNPSVSSGDEDQDEDTPRYSIIDSVLEVETVLVPRDITVISSSRDGRIINLPFRSGDRFKKGDVLVEYDCRALEAEADIAKTEKSFTEEKLSGGYKLFKLELMSDIERKNLEVEDEKARARQRLYAARLDDCVIRADYDGRITNRLANTGEYTRTDRVLLEVASNAPLKADFLIPSKWLRWVNVGAPVTIAIQETDKDYQATISRIHGEVDPISQSIQVTAQIEPYKDPLLPGMSGKAVLNIDDIRSKGIRGFLEGG